MSICASKPIYFLACKIICVLFLWYLHFLEINSRQTKEKLVQAITRLSNKKLPKHILVYKSRGRREPGTPRRGWGKAIHKLFFLMVDGFLNE
jgi:hypothetical protein